MTTIDRTAALSALADRVESEGPSRDLDADIGRALGRTAKAKNVYKRNVYPRVLLRVEAVFPAYTSSLDAAVTLVPEGWMWLTQAAPQEEALAIVRQYLPVYVPESIRADAKTPAAALTAAALRAIAQEMENG